MLNNHDIAVLGLLASGVLFVSTVALAIAWVRARERSLRALLEAQTAENGSVATMKLAQAVEAIALEVERISEGQRFVTKLLAERKDQRPALASHADPPRVVTPH